MAYFDIRGNLETVVQKTEKETFIGIKDEKGESHSYQFKNSIPIDWSGKEVWYRQWTHGYWRFKKIYQELGLTENPVKFIASQYPCPRFL